MEVILISFWTMVVNRFGVKVSLRNKRKIFNHILRFYTTKPFILNGDRKTIPIISSITLFIFFAKLLSSNIIFGNIFRLLKSYKCTIKRISDYYMHVTFYMLNGLESNKIQIFLQLPNGCKWWRLAAISSK